MAIAAGKEGSFELNDMARWLSQQMGAASAAGMKGKDDFVKILALNEAAAITAGSSDEAGNNVVNLLAKLTSKDIETAAAGINYNGKGIDFSGTLTEAREHGLNPIDALSSLIDKIVASDKRYQELQRNWPPPGIKASRRLFMIRWQHSLKALVSESWLQTVRR